MPTKEEIMAQIQIFKNAKGTLVQDSLIKILEMLCNGAAGADGYSPTVSTTNLDAQTLVTVTDNNGAHNFYVKDGSSVTNAAVDANGDLIISIQQKPTSGVHPTIHTLEVNAGHVVGAKGDKGDKGDTGNDYVLTAQDKADIADIVLQELPTTQGMLYGNTSN